MPRQSLDTRRGAARSRGSLRRSGRLTLSPRRQLRGGSWRTQVAGLSDIYRPWVPGTLWATPMSEPLGNGIGARLARSGNNLYALRQIPLRGAGISLAVCGSDPGKTSIGCGERQDAALIALMLSCSHCCCRCTRWANCFLTSRAFHVTIL